MLDFAKESPKIEEVNLIIDADRLPLYLGESPSGLSHPTYNYGKKTYFVSSFKKNETTYVKGIFEIDTNTNSVMLVAEDIIADKLNYTLHMVTAGKFALVLIKTQHGGTFLYKIVLETMTSNEIELDSSFRFGGGLSFFNTSDSKAFIRTFRNSKYELLILNLMDDSSKVFELAPFNYFESFVFDNTLFLTSDYRNDLTTQDNGHYLFNEKTNSFDYAFSLSKGTSTGYSSSTRLIAQTPDAVWGQTNTENGRFIWTLEDNSAVSTLYGEANPMVSIDHYPAVIEHELTDRENFIVNSKEANGDEQIFVHNTIEQSGKLIYSKNNAEYSPIYKYLGYRDNKLYVLLWTNETAVIDESIGEIDLILEPKELPQFCGDSVYFYTLVRNETSSYLNYFNYTDGVVNGNPEFVSGSVATKYGTYLIFASPSQVNLNNIYVHDCAQMTNKPIMDEATISLYRNLTEFHLGTRILKTLNNNTIYFSVAHSLQPGYLNDIYRYDIKEGLLTYQGPSYYDDLRAANLNTVILDIYNEATQSTDLYKISNGKRTKVNSYPGRIQFVNTVDNDPRGLVFYNEVIPSSPHLIVYSPDHNEFRHLNLDNSNTYLRTNALFSPDVFMGNPERDPWLYDGENYYFPIRLPLTTQNLALLSARCIDELFAGKTECDNGFANLPPTVLDIPDFFSSKSKYIYIPTRAFDSDLDTLQFELNGDVPNWLNFNSYNGDISGFVPDDLNEATYELTVSVSDGIDTKTTSLFTINIGTEHESSDSEESEESTDTSQPEAENSPPSNSGGGTTNAFTLLCLFGYYLLRLKIQNRFKD